jgi:hypothetical protein
MLNSSISDYTGAERVSITIGCDSSLKDVALVVYWSTSIATIPIGTSVITSDSLLFTNAGGAVVPVFGQQFQIEVRNGGSTPVSCPQLSAYAVVH